MAYFPMVLSAPLPYRMNIWTGVVVKTSLVETETETEINTPETKMRLFSYETQDQSSETETLEVRDLNEDREH